MVSFPGRGAYDEAVVGRTLVLRDSGSLRDHLAKCSVWVGQKTRTLARPRHGFPRDRLRLSRDPGRTRTGRTREDLRPCSCSCFMVGSGKAERLLGAGGARGV